MKYAYLSLKISILFFFLIISQTTQAQISGKVFRDFNANGMKDTSATFKEPFVKAITVKAYDKNGVEVGSTTSDTNGAYSFTGLALPLRIEFTGLSIGDFSTAAGTGNNSSIQFYSSATSSANFGINYPDDYCNNNPFFASNVYVSSPGTNGLNGLAAIPYGTTGTNAPGKQDLGTPYSTIGSVWGMAHQRESNTLFSAAFMKRHTAFGSGGTGAIYATTGTNTPATSATTLYLNLQTLTGITTGANTHATDLTIDQNNANGSPYDAVGKVSFGDMDMSSDGKYIFVVNLFEKKIHRIFIDNPAKPAASLTAADVTSWNIPNPCDATFGTSRPWGLSVNRGKVYVGVVCDASISLSKDNLSATVYEMDPATGIFTSVLNFPLNYLHGAASDTPTSREYWNAWRPNYYKAPTSTSYGEVNPQPILSDIDFDTDGSMILGFTDRAAHQLRIGGPIQDGTGSSDPRLAGDILRAGKCSAANTWTIENNASVCGGTPTAGAGNTQGPGGGEFYFGEQFNGNHLETSQGAVAMLRGSNQIVLGVMDPLNIYSAGFYYMNNTTGDVDGKYELVTNSSGAFGKAGAIGDVEMLCLGQPIEIGNRVFFDTDRDGVQDADEAGIGNITLEIFADFDANGVPDGTLLGTTNTNSNGLWYFNNSNIVDGDPIIVGNQAGLLFNKNYIVRIATSDWTGGIGTAELSGKVLSTANVGGAGQADAIDSDATIVSTIPQISVLIGNSGENNHTLDFGFQCPSIVTPSTNQSVCVGSAGSNITVNTTTNATNSIKFVKFMTDQILINSSPTPSELATIYGGTRILATVTPSGTVNPYTATYTWNSVDFATAGTYYVYAILANDASGDCRPVQEIKVEVNPLPTFTLASNNVTCFGNSNGNITITTTSGTAPFIHSIDDGITFPNTTGVFNNLSPNTYKSAVKDANGCIKKCQ